MEMFLCPETEHWTLQNTTEDVSAWQDLQYSATCKLQELSPQEPDLSALNDILMDACRTFRASPAPQDQPECKWAWALSWPAAPWSAPADGSWLLGVFCQWRRAIKREQWRKRARKQAQQHRRERVQQIVNKVIALITTSALFSN